MELRYKIGKIETEEMIIGDLVHQKVIEKGKMISIKDAIRKIKTSRVCTLSNFPLLTKIEEIPVMGIIDQIIFKNGKPFIIADLRTTRTKSLYVGKDKFVQLRMYGICLEHMNFDCSNLKLLIGVQKLNNFSPLFGPVDYVLDIIHLEMGKRLMA